MSYAPTALAEHIVDMNVIQKSALVNAVTIQVHYNTSGDCCGGVFFWTTGDGASGNAEDGFQQGVYLGDGAGAGVLSDNRPFTYSRTRPDPIGQPGYITMDITYSYNAAGTYTVTWNDCCIFVQGSLTVTTGDPPVGKVLRIDTGVSGSWNALQNAGIPDCGTGAAFCYENVSTAAFATAVLSNYKVIYVGSNASGAAIDALTARKTDIQNYLAFNSPPGNLVVYAQHQQNSILNDPWAWVPTGSSPAITWTDGHGDDIHLTPAGQAHMSHFGQTDLTLSGWSNSRHNSFNAVPSWFTLLSTDNTASKKVTLAGHVDVFGMPKGCVFITGQDADLHSTGGSGINPTPSRPAATQLVRSSLIWADLCPPT